MCFFITFGSFFYKKESVIELSEDVYIFLYLLIKKENTVIKVKIYDVLCFFDSEKEYKNSIIKCRSPPPIKLTSKFNLIGGFSMIKGYNLSSSEKLYLKKIIINARNKYFDKNKYISKEIILHMEIQ